MTRIEYKPDLILYNAKVITIDIEKPTAELVAIKGDKIQWVGMNHDLSQIKGAETGVIDCQGMTVVPGFIDAHCHFLAYASSLLAVDCSPREVQSIEGIKRVLKCRADITPRGEWIRANGYDEFYLDEHRHPTRDDLDDVTPHHPVRLNHRSGHAAVLNSMALSMVGISHETSDPSDGVIDRDFDTGRPTGLLMEMNAYVGKMVPSLTHSQLIQGVELANERFLETGITYIEDATVSNGVSQWETFSRLKRSSLFSPGVAMMVGARKLREFVEAGLVFGSGDSSLKLGAVKVMATLTTGSLQPPLDELKELVFRAQEAGFQVAIHAVEANVVETAAEVIRLSIKENSSGADLRHRIEHCSECPPQVLKKLHEAGVVVVTQPGFLYYSGWRYLNQVSEESQHWLYRIASFAKNHINVAASSDAPVTHPNPMVGIYSAVTRKTIDGSVVLACESISPTKALKMHTYESAYAAFEDAFRGSIKIGNIADLTILDRDPTRIDPEDIKDIKVEITIIGGSVVFTRSG